MSASATVIQIATTQYLQAVSATVEKKADFCLVLEVPVSFETEMRVYVEVIRRRSFARAAEALGISRPSASRLFRAFEERFAPQLATRTPQRMELFPLGNAVFERALVVVQKMDELKMMSRDASGSGRVKLTVACTTELAVSLVDAACRSFAEDTPDVEVEVVEVPSGPGALSESVDLVVDFGPPNAGKRFAVQRLADEKYVFVAAAEAAALQRKPQSIAQLTAARFIWVGKRAQPVRWLVSRRSDHWDEVELTATVCDSDCEFVLDAVKKGLGVGIFPNWLAATSIARGDLVTALPGWNVATASKSRRLNAYVNTLSPSADAVRRLLDAIRARLLQPRKLESVRGSAPESDEETGKPESR